LDNRTQVPLNLVHGEDFFAFIVFMHQKRTELIFDLRHHLAISRAFTKRLGDGRPRGDEDPTASPNRPFDVIESPHIGRISERQ